tara:strand:- start:410 stop:754 length:345 start_codon:yes stop_codon:yes gene_type:complete
MSEQPRSTQINKAMHVLFDNISTELLAKGVERKTIINDLEGYSCPIDAAFIKEVWRSIMFTMTGKTSTTQMTNQECTKCYDVLNKFLGEEYAVHLPWPSVEEMMLSYLDNQQYQ